MVTAVYIHPQADFKAALSHLENALTRQQNKHHLIAGDFNRYAMWYALLPKFHQHIKCTTRGDRTLDKAYSNIKHGYRATQLPHLGPSDHMGRQ